jgi:thioredoxin 1
LKNPTNLVGFFYFYAMNELTNTEEIQNLIAEKPAVVFYFYNDSCQPCVALRPKILELIDEKFPKMELYFINSAKNPEVNGQFNIFASPVILVFFDRKEYIRKSKYVSIPEIEKEIQRYYQLMFD